MEKQRIHRISTDGMSRDMWLIERRKGIGGSDAAAVVGMNKYRSAYDVYVDKKGLAPEAEDNEAMRQGRDLEEYVARRFAEATGKRVCKNNAILYNSAYPFARANIDRAVIGEKAGLECKTISVLNLKRYKSGEFPEEYYVQCMHYLMVTGWERWYLAVLVFGTEFKIFTIERDEDEIKALARAEKMFWDDYITGDKEPFPAGTESTDRVIQSLYPNDNGETCDLTPLNDELKRLADLRGIENTLKLEKKTLQQRIKSYMAKCSYGKGSSYKVSWKSSVRSDYDTKAIIRDFIPEGTDLSKYIKTTQVRKFIIKEEK